MAVSFKVNNTDIPPLINFAISKPVFSVFASIPFTTTSKFFLNDVSALSLKSLSNVTNKHFPRITW